MMGMVFTVVRGGRGGGAIMYKNRSCSVKRPSTIKVFRKQNDAILSFPD